MNLLQLFQVVLQLQMPLLLSLVSLPPFVLACQWRTFQGINYGDVHSVSHNGCTVCHLNNLWTDGLALSIYSNFHV